MAKGLRGIGRVRRIMRGLPGTFAGEFIVSLNLAGRKLQTAMRARAPERTGATKQGITYRVFPQSLRMRVGLLGTKAGRSKLFYAQIQDLGRKEGLARRAYPAKMPKAGRRKFAGKYVENAGRAYVVRVRAMAPKRFVTGRFPDLRRSISEEMKDIFSRALRRISGTDGE